MDKDGEVAQAESRVIEILQVAWRRYAQLALRAQSLDRRTRWGGIWIALLGLIFVALAYIFDIYSPTIPDISAIVIRGLFIVTPIIVAILAAYRGRSSGISGRTSGCSPGTTLPGFWKGTHARALRWGNTA
jgi:hypothetical protein